MIRPLAPGSMVLVSKGQPYDMALVMDRGQLLVETYNGFT